MKFCPQCGTTFDPESRFCLECGFDISTVKSEEPSIPQSHSNETNQITAEGIVSQTQVKPHCPQCGITTDTNDRFCPDCGFDTSTVSSVAEEVHPTVQPQAEDINSAPLIPVEQPVSLTENKQSCPKCYSVIDDGERFCKECGFDTSISAFAVSDSSPEVEQPIVEEEFVTPIPVEQVVLHQANNQFCQQCGLVIATGERFCQECGFDTMAENASNEIKPEPVAPPPGIEIAPAPEPEVEPHYPDDSSRNTVYGYSQTINTVETPIRQKSKKNLLRFLLIILGVGVLGAAGWYGYTNFFSSGEERTEEMVTTMEIPENSVAEPVADETESEAQSSSDPSEKPDANAKPLSRIDQELAKHKTKGQNQSATKNAADPNANVSPHTTDSDIIAKIILEVGRKEEPKNKNPKNPTKLKLSKPTMIVRITTDHYNDGMGTPRGGIITITDQQGNIVGKYKALGRTGMNGTPSAKWIIEPNKMLEKGTYYILDSEMSTWSKTFVGGNGFVVVEGYEVE